MPTQEQVFEAADKILAQGKDPSRRPIMKKLGGSPRNIDAHLKAWRQERAFPTVPRQGDVPEKIRKKLVLMGIELWRTAQLDAAEAWQQEREKIEAIRKAESEDQENLLGLFEGAQASIADLKARLADTIAEVERLRAALAVSQDQANRLRSEAFWDRLMQEVRALLPEQGGLTPDEVLPMLEPWTKRGAAVAKQRLNATTLKTKMEDREHWGRYMVDAGDGRFVRRAG